MPHQHGRYQNEDKVHPSCCCKEPDPDPTTPGPGKAWSRQDSKLVEKIFYNSIDSKKAPSLKECASKIRKIPSKQIQDKVRTIIRQKRKEEEDLKKKMKMQ
jgi:hypothetical protein